MPLTDEEAITFVLLHGGYWHYSSSPGAGPAGWAAWRGDEGRRAWSYFCRATLGEACRWYCERHGLGQDKV